VTRVTENVEVVVDESDPVPDPPCLSPEPPVPEPDPEVVPDPDFGAVDPDPVGDVGGGTKVNSALAQSVGSLATTVSTVGDEPKAHTESPAAEERQA
jgi:hypothetical protein